MWVGGGGGGSRDFFSLFSFKLFDTRLHEVLFAIRNDHLKK